MVKVRMAQTVNQSLGFKTGICKPMGDFTMTPYIYIQAMGEKNMLINSFRLLEKKNQKHKIPQWILTYFVLPPLQPLTFPC